MIDGEKLVPRPKLTFLQVKWPECGNEQLVLSSVTTNVVPTLLIEMT
jgi:ribosomal protein S27E